MDGFSVPIVPILAIVCMIGLPVIFLGILVNTYLRTRNQERMEMIRNGAILEEAPRRAPNKYVSLRNGVLCIGLALGVILGIIAINQFNFDDFEAVVVVGASAILCLGLAYVLFFFVVKNKSEEEMDKSIN